MLVDAFRLHGVDRIFCVPGESYLDVLDALHDTPEIQLVVAKHEGAAANMAEADGKLTGRLGVCFVTRGPGATHATVGVYTAAHDSTPMILCVGQVPRDMRGRGAFQEVECRELFRPLAKWVSEIERADQIPEQVRRAVQIATAGRPGPVVLSLPEDVLAETSTGADVGPSLEPLSSLSEQTLAAISSVLDGASRPLVIVGGSRWSDEGCAALARFVRANRLPVVASFRRQDLLDNRDSTYVGHLTIAIPPHLQRRARAADVILALGTRLGDISTAGFTLFGAFRPQACLVHIHPDPHELNTVYHADIAGIAPPSAAAVQLSALAPVNPSRWLEWTAGARREHEAFADVPERPRAGVDLAAAITYVSKNLPSSAVVSSGAGNFAVWVHRFFAYKQRSTQLAPTSGAMGYGLPAAIAASLRHPGRVSLCVAGDGDFLMYPQELATAAQHGARVIVLLVNNGRYGTIRMHQERRFPGRPSGTNLAGPNYVALARSFGAHAERVETTGAFAAAFDRALSVDGSVVLDLRVDPDQVTPDHRLNPSRSPSSG